MITLAAGYFAQSIFDHNLSQLFPTWLLDAYPPLYQFTRWLPADLFELALWIVTLAAIVFGLLIPPWRTPVYPHDHFPLLTTGLTRSIKEQVGFLCILLALASAFVNLAYLWRTGSDSRQVQLAWAGALLIYLVSNLPAKINIARQAPWLRSEPYLADNPNRPIRRWLTLGLICGITVVLWAWPVRGMAVAVDEPLAQIGLRAAKIAQGLETRLFEGEQNGVPPLALVPAAIAMRLSGDPLLGMRVTGLFNSLILICATWLLGRELFRRPLLLGDYGEIIEDDGQWLALMAAALVAANMAVLTFSRLPIYVEPLGWGVLSGWALLRGQRTGDRLAYALSGVLSGLVLLLYPSGLVFPLTILLWWMGTWLLQRTQLQTRHTEPAPNRASWLDFFVWLGGIFVVIAPLIGLWLRMPALFWGRFQSLQLHQLGTILGWLPPTSTLSYPEQWLGSILAPLFLLAIGALLFNADQLPGLLLLLWLGIGGLVGSSMVNPPHNMASLLPIIPAVALALAFTLDRIRITLLATVGTWLVQATTYVAVGIVLWAGFTSWVATYQNLQMNNTAPNTTGYAVRTLGVGESAVLWLGQQSAEVNWDTPVLKFLTLNLPSTRDHLTLTPEQWLPQLPPRSQVLIQPEDYAASIGEIMAHYPGGRLTTQRDLRGNPLIYHYALP